MGLASDISGLLSTQGFTSASIFIGELPERPATALSILQTAGLGSQHTFGSAAGTGVHEQCRFQLLARSTDYETGESVINTAHLLLDGMRPRGMNGKLYQWITAVSTPYYIGLDDEQRQLFSCNYDVLRSLTT